MLPNVQAGLIKSNVSPNKGLLGVNLGLLKPVGGDGQLFAAAKDYPHGDYGVLFGFDYWKRNLNSFDWHLALNGRYAISHFHHTPNGESELSGYFRDVYVSVPFLLHFSIPKYRYLQLLAGAGVASFNFISSHSGSFSDFSYSTTIDHKWYVAPELHLGINFMEEKTDFMFIRGKIQYTNFPLRNQSYEVAMNDGTDFFEASDQSPSHKIEIVITIYPKWKIKRSIGKDEGINCPSPF